MITMIDMKISNLDSVRRALERVGAEVQVTESPDDVERASLLLIPGVGAFGDGMDRLHQKRLVEAIRKHALESRKPVIGICLGMQLLADESEEHGQHQGLGLIPGRVVRLKPCSDQYRVPNMGWCDVRFRRNRAPLDLFSEMEIFYFAHSYHVQCRENNHIAATIEYDGQDIVVALQHENVFGVQFHPERSQDAGLALLHCVLKHFAIPHAVSAPVTSAPRN